MKLQHKIGKSENGIKNESFSCSFFLGVFPVFVILGYRLAFDTFLTAAQLV